MTEAQPGSMPLGEIAYRRLREDIVACRLAPGQWLTEHHLAAETGLGISPIREALTRLDHEGLVRTLPRKGYQVKSLTIKVVDDLFEYWEVLGPEIVRRGITRGTEEQIGQVVAGFEKIVRLLTEERPSQDLARRVLPAIDQAFAALAEGTHNEYIIASCYRLSGQLARVWTLTLDLNTQDGGKLDDFLTEVEVGVDVLTRRDGAAAAEQTRRHIQQARGRILRTLARWPSIVTAEVVPLNRPSQTV